VHRRRSRHRLLLNGVGGGARNGDSGNRAKSYTPPVVARC
jgi:hypothetical protein